MLATCQSSAIGCTMQSCGGRVNYLEGCKAVDAAADHSKKYLLQHWHLVGAQQKNEDV